ncbi:tryptophan--tRNA ligase [Thalassococcus sp. S3]|uniref:tryptophan--tRNA ligase n=1 Tax=Thalassococcus sp. S3 TaxID=2017482 RepID=UPI0013EE6C53|nr:tryptophan--tRNA ligase [Thalassococcus sp. S3]
MKPRYLSGIQATGTPHIGNYLGAIKNWVASQNDETDAFYMVADLHAITVQMPADEVRRNRLETMAGLLACGLDPHKVTLFFQSDVRAHCEMYWLLGSKAYFGELQRMTQFKSKGGGKQDVVSLDLFAYPVLQAADILLYQADFVPVGHDQVQHIELTRNIAARCNDSSPDLFKIPQPVVPTVGARVMNLQAPTSKMSKSDRAARNGVIMLTDDNDTIKTKVMRAVTDSENRIAYSGDQPGVQNLIEIICALTDSAPDEVLDQLAGQGYGALKSFVVDLLVETVEPIRTSIQELLAHPEDVFDKISVCTQTAQGVAEGTLSAARAAFGYGSPSAMTSAPPALQANHHHSGR